MLTRPLNVQLGTGTCPMEGWINCDLMPTKYSDMAFDCQDPWPFADNTVGHVYASHMLEHLARPLDFFREMHRCLIPNGTVSLRMPFGGHRSAWIDLTHLRPWFPEAFAALQPGYAKAVGNPQHKEWTAFYGVDRCQLRINPVFRRWVKIPVIRRLFLRSAAHITDSVEELWAFLFALKTPDAVDEYEKTHPANQVPAQYAMYRHQFYKERVNPEIGLQLVPFGEDGFVDCHYERRELAF